MRVPVIPFTTTDDGEQVVDWGVDVDLALTLAAGEEVRQKRKWKLFGGQERYRSISRFHWPFWVVRRGSRVLFVDGVTEPKVPAIEPIDLEGILRTLNMNLSTPVDWGRLADELEVWIRDITRVGREESLRLLPAEVVADLCLGFNRAELLIESDINSINPQLDHEDAQSIAREILEFIEQLGVETQRIQNLYDAAIQRSEEWQNHVSRMLEETRMEWQSRIDAAEAEYQREVSEVQSALSE
jgi:hypothetical protein